MFSFKLRKNLETGHRIPKPPHTIHITYANVFGLIQLWEPGRHWQSTTSCDFSKAISAWSSPLCTLVHPTELTPRGYDVWLNNISHLARTMMYFSTLTTTIKSIQGRCLSSSYLYLYADIHNLCFAYLLGSN